METFELLVGPYSLGCDLQAPLAAFSTIEELEAAEVSDSIILLRGDLVKEQMMPKNFPFYNPDHHRRARRVCWRRNSRWPSSAATGRDPGLAGGVYPFPLIRGW